MSTTSIQHGLQPTPLYSAAPALVPSGSPAGPPARLVASAHEFEAQMMKELLAPLSSTGTGDDDGDPGSGGALASYSTEALGRALSASGGFGMADRILHSISHSGTTNPHPPVTGIAPTCTQIKRAE